MRYEYKPIFINFFKSKGIDFNLELRIRHKCTGGYGIFIYFGICAIYRFTFIGSLIGEFNFKKEN